MVEKPALPPRPPSTAYAGDLQSPISMYDLSSQDSTHYLSPTASVSPTIHPADRYSPYLGGLKDPRASSTQSLRPVESARATNRRTLLIIYIHGFLGDETSFQSFPAHVHGLLTNALAETHVVYTKIYPRYKSRKNVSFAKDDFSNWLAPHESDNTDIILVGHSLGGILAAEVALIPCHTPRNNQLFQHSLLGLIAVDVPFLGMHPGVVGTGLASLFRTPAELPQSPIRDETPFSDPFSSSDPNFNPAYTNDIHLANRQGKLQKAWYFWNKHAGEVVSAAGRYVSSHLEFGGVLADYPGMKRRYNAVRALEDVDELLQTRAPNGRLMQRVRFVNYYSASTGRIKERSPSPTGVDNLLEPPGATTELQRLSPRPSSEDGTEKTLSIPPSPSPRISLEEHRDGEVITKDIAELQIDPDPPGDELPTVASEPTTASSVNEASSSVISPLTSHSTLRSTDSRVYQPAVPDENNLPPLPRLPDPPPSFDATPYNDEDELKLARKEHDRQIKAYERAVRDREKSLKDREKLVQKRQREAIKRQERDAKQAKQEELRVHKENLKRASTLNPEEWDKHVQHETEMEQNTSGPSKKQKDRKFCTLPAKDPRTGRRDPTWIRVYMEGIDEVVAHTSMFKMSETYVKMVGDTAERIERWIAEDATKRLLLAEMRHGSGNGL